jgi:hypothetical protein
MNLPGNQHASPEQRAAKRTIRLRRSDVRRKKKQRTLNIFSCAGFVDVYPPALLPASHAELS